MPRPARKLFEILSALLQGYYRLLGYAFRVSEPTQAKNSCYCPFNGTVAWDFRPLAFIINRPRLSPCFISNFFEFCLKFAELFKFKNCSALWAIAGYKIFLQIPVLSHRDVISLFIYVHFSAPLFLYRFGKLFKKNGAVLCYGNWFGAMVLSA
jgi:hypothetical protein